MVDRLERATARLAERETVPSLLAAAAEALTELVEGDACAISRVVGDVLVDVAQHSPSGQSLTLGQGYLISDYPLTREVVDSRKPRSVSVHDAAADAAEARLLRELGFDALLMAPLVARGAVWALVEVYDRGDRRFDDSDEELAGRFLDHVGSRLQELG